MGSPVGLSEHFHTAYSRLKLGVIRGIAEPARMGEGAAIILCQKNAEDENIELLCDEESEGQKAELKGIETGETLRGQLLARSSTGR